MDLRETIEYIRGREKELCLFNTDPSDPVHEDLGAFFETQNVRIAVDRTASGKPDGVAILSDATGVLAIVDVTSLRELLDDVPAGAGNLGIADGEYASLLCHLKETTFTSYDTEQLIYASQEIEDRARRIGRGSIHAGFQRCSAITEQQSIYTNLARQGVSVHAYGIPDTTLPDLGSGRVHAVPTDDIAETWFVVFDGGGDDAQKTALLAREYDEGSFYGSWTYDPGLVNHVLDYLDQTRNTAPDDAARNI